MLTGSFGGIISDEPIRSVQITCEFDADLKCGIYDLQFGTKPIPVPAALPLAATGLVALLRGTRRRRNAAIGTGSRCQSD